MRRLTERSQVDEQQFTLVEAIINSVTRKERLNSSIINGSRRKRIATGSVTTIMEVNNLKRARISKMFKTMGSGGGMGKMQQRPMSQMGGMQRFGR